MKQVDPNHWTNDLAFLLYDCSRLLRRRIDEQLVDFGLREAQWRVIGLLGQGQGLSQTELATLMGIQKAPLGEQLDRLESECWIERRRDPQDRRANQLFIHPAALDQAATINQRMIELVTTLQAAFPAGHWQTMQTLLGALASGYICQATQQTLSRLQFVTNLHLIGLISRQLRKQFDGELKQLGTTRSQWLLLSAVIFSPGINQRQLSQRLDMAKAPLGQVLDQLVQRGWLSRSPDPADKRRNQLQVVDAAKPTLKQVAAQYQHLHLDFDRQLGHQSLLELKQHLQLFRRLLLSLVEQPTTTETL